ncbi:MAG: beta-ketoacyl-[acyl-carrier-protein] synthase family protein [Planctomycetales bacterium]
MTPPLSERVLLTGLGMVTPAAPHREESWQRLVQGTSAVRWVEWDELFPPGNAPRLDSEDPASRWLGAPVPRSAADRDEGLHGTGSGRPAALALRAAAEALCDARLEPPLLTPLRTGCVIGASKGGFGPFTAAWRAARDPQNNAPAGDWWSALEPADGARQVASRYDLRGAALCPVAACATGLMSIARGADLIREGVCDLVLAGSSDASLHAAILASYRRLRVLARPTADPSASCRPFDRHRSGFVIGEGAAIVVLERADQALARGAIPYAEWLAGGLASDPSHLAHLGADPVGLTWLIQDVLRRGGVSADDIDYINLHGTATRENDPYETRALHQALGRRARDVPLSSLKGTIGHLLGAAGSVELGATLLAMRDSLVPPTANLWEPDPDCDLDYTPRFPRPRQIDTALKLSLGFGGHLAAGLLRRWDSGPSRAPREHSALALQTAAPSLTRSASEESQSKRSTPSSPQGTLP